MKTKLYRKWLKYCKCFNKKSYKMYASSLGDKFFEKCLKYSRLWHKIKVECDLNRCTTKGIYCQDHLLHSYCPSVRFNKWWYTSDLDFSYMYPTVMRIPEVVVDDNGNITFSHKKTFSYKKKIV